MQSPAHGARQIEGIKSGTELQLLLPKAGGTHEDAAVFPGCLFVMPFSR